MCNVRMQRGGTHESYEPEQHGSSLITTITITTAKTTTMSIMTTTPTRKDLRLLLGRFGSNRTYLPRTIDSPSVIAAGSRPRESLLGTW